MPQLDIAWFPSQVFWLTVTFIAIYIFVTYFIVPGFGAVVEGRKRRVNDDLKKAESSKDKALELEKEYLSTLEKARAEGSKLVIEAIARANSETIEKTAALDKKIAKRLSDAEKKISEFRNKLVKDMQAEEVKVVKLILNKVADIKIADDEIAQALNSAERS